ncbi:MAG: phosphatase PAP2 family protein [Lachnospiraceae bacterium]|nr:phosphatase PAP2 family protein [Lachnospiraceae bacterium]
MKAFFIKYHHAWTLLYFPVYMMWFTWLERTVTTDTSYTNIHVYFDDLIPFCEWFVIPYVLWFVYIVVVMAFVLFTSRKEFYKASIYMFAGMSMCLLICTLWPNGQDLRVDEFAKDNILTSLMGFIYSADTNTNVFPSIHVYNSVGAVILISKNYILRKYNWLKISATILSILIILSTMFLKQHSVIDVLGGLALATLMYIPVYAVNWPRVAARVREKRRAKVLVTDNKN